MEQVLAPCTSPADKAARRRVGVRPAGDIHDVASSAKDELLAVYLERRPVLIRSFAARTGSQDRAEDIVQDIYVRLHALSDANAAEVQNPIAFLYRIGGNLVLDAVRQGKRMAARDQAWTEASGASLDGVSIADQPSPEEAAWARLKLDQVARALEGFAPKARQAFRLHRLDGLTHAQIADRLGVSTSSVEKYLSAVLARLLVEVGWP